MKKLISIKWRLLVTPVQRGCPVILAIDYSFPLLPHTNLCCTTVTPCDAIVFHIIQSSGSSFIISDLDLIDDTSVKHRGTALLTKRELKAV